MVNNTTNQLHIETDRELPLMDRIPREKKPSRIPEAVKYAAEKVKDAVVRFFQAIGRAAVAAGRFVARVISYPVNLAIWSVKFVIWGTKSIKKVAIYLKNNPEIVAAATAAVGVLALSGDIPKAIQTFTFGMAAGKLAQKKYLAATKWGLSGVGIGVIPLMAYDLILNGTQGIVSSALQNPVVLGSIAATTVGVVAARKGYFQGFWDTLKGGFQDALKQPPTIM